MMKSLKWWCCVASFFLLVSHNCSGEPQTSNDHSGQCPQQRTDDNAQCKKLMRKNVLDMFVRKYGTNRILKESICLLDGECVDIVDTAEYGTEKYSVVREIVAGIFRHSKMHLKLPNKITDDSMDSSRWELDKGAEHDDSYLNTMIDEMFISGAVKIRRDADAKVLSIGLGAGYIASYLHYHFPKMDITSVELDPTMLQIARDWFDLKEDHRHRVIIEDGLEYMRRAVGNGVQYDVLHLDACTSDLHAETLCPRNIFITNEALKLLSDLVTTRGVVIVNVISAKYMRGIMGNQLKSLFEKFFHQCVIKQPIKSINEVLSCSHSIRPEGLDVVYEKFSSRNQKTEE